MKEKSFLKKFNLNVQLHHMYYVLKSLGIKESQNFEQGGGINYKSVHETNLKPYLQKLTILERRAGNGCGCISILKLIYNLFKHLEF